MALKNVKVTMSRLGVHTMEGNTLVYMPLANIEYIELGKKKKKTAHLDGKMVSDKKYFKGWVLPISSVSQLTLIRFMTKTGTGLEHHPSRNLENRFKQMKMTSSA